MKHYAKWIKQCKKYGCDDGQGMVYTEISKDSDRKRQHKYINPKRYDKKLHSFGDMFKMYEK